MRLSDAIATGRVLIPSLKVGDIESCALGMAALAVGIEVKGKTPYSDLREKWMWLAQRGYSHCADCLDDELADGLTAIYRAFDSHVMFFRDMTLDQLIDWVRSIEPTEEAEEWKPLCQYTDDEKRIYDLQHQAGCDDRE